MTASQLIYSQSFVSVSTYTAQCTAWQNFLALLTIRTYTLLKIQGTYDTVGRSTNDSTVIGNIAQALRTSVGYGPITSNGVSWVVNSCGSGYELSGDGSTCQCATAGYSVRPCIGNANFGGINTATCSGPSQTLTVTFHF